MKEKIIIWLTGNSGVGKTTLARILKERLNAIHIDGDEMRASISETAGFSRKDRHEHNMRCARLVKVLHSQGFNIVVSVIAPFQETRDEINTIIQPIWIYVKREQPLDGDKPYEIPQNPDVTVDTGASIDESIRIIFEKLEEK